MEDVQGQKFICTVRDSENVDLALSWRICGEVCLFRANDIPRRPTHGVAETVHLANIRMVLASCTFRENW